MVAVNSNPKPLLLEADMEKSLDKSHSADQHASQTSDSGVANSSNEEDGYNSDGKPWHDGVLRIRAITTMWSKTSMWTMFGL